MFLAGAAETEEIVVKDADRIHRPDARYRGLYLAPDHENHAVAAQEADL